MMFLLSVVVVLIITIGVNGQTNDINTGSWNNVEKGYPFGQLRLSEEGKNEELIVSNAIGKSQINQDQSSGVQPLSSPCTGASPSTKLAYPREKTKYIQCRDEFHYEIFTCPNGGEYNDQTNSCDLTVPMIDRCEQEKPCLNSGQCQLLSNSTYKCTCRQDWTGDRCETPLNSCVQKPCGPNAECRTLKTSDYEQDYVCVCHGKRGYGLNCQEIVSNPCLTTAEQFFPYAFSQHAYIQCNGELIYFQPCNSLLYWNQEDKICDRKRPAKIDLPTLLAKLGSNNNENQQEKNEDINLTAGQVEQQNSLSQNGKENEPVFAFVPARVANRQQLLANMNNQQGLVGQNLRENEQKTQEVPSQSVGSNQIRQDFTSQAVQWPNSQTETTIRKPSTLQSGQKQLWSQNNQQQQWTPTLTDLSSVGSNVGQSQIKQDYQQQQNLPQQTQSLGSQQWLNQVPQMTVQNNQRFASQPQSWQGTQTVQNQPQFQNQNEQLVFETTTAAQNIIRLQGFQNPNTKAQDQSWQTRPNTQVTGIQSPQTGGFNPQTQSWESSQTIQNQPRSQDQNQQLFLETTTLAPNVFRLQGFKPANTQWTGNQSPQSIGFNSQNNQNFLLQQQPWKISQSLQNQPQLTPTNSAGIAMDNKNRFNTGIQQNTQLGLEQQTVPQQTQAFGSQQWSNQVPQMTAQNNQRFVSQSQPWQGSQTVQNQPQFQTQNQQLVVETTTIAQNINRLQGIQNSNVQTQDQSWQTQQTQNQVTRPPSSQIIAFQPKQWPDTSKQIPPVNPSTEIQNTQFGLNQPQKSLPVQNSLDQKQSWSTNQQFQPQGSQLTDSDDSQIQTTQNLAARPVPSSQTQPWLQNGQMTANSFETTTIANNGIQQPLSVQGSRAWQPKEQDNNQITTNEQRKTSDSIPTLLPASWKSRST